MLTRSLLVITNHQNRPYVTTLLEQSVTAVLVNDPWMNSDWVNSGITTYSYGDILGNNSFGRGIDGSLLKQSTVDALLGCQHTYYILDRRRGIRIRDRRDNYKNSFNYVQFVLEGANKARSILLSENVNRVIFTSTPHDLESWLLFHAAYDLDLPVKAVAESALPWRGVVKTIVPDRDTGYAVTDVAGKAEPVGSLTDPSPTTQSYVSLKASASYQKAEPGYMRRQRIAKPYRIMKKVKNMISGATSLSWDGFLEYAQRNWQRRCLWRATNRYSRELPASPFVTVFLHYQPERTSVPEGGRYAQQFRIILDLLALLPSGWAVVVKEHPSTFMLEMSRPFRHPRFYAALGDHARVVLASPNVSSFALIDESEAVATLTGRVGFEALCRQTPVMVFGDAPYKECPGVIDMARGPTRAFVAGDSLAEAKCRLHDGELERYLARVEVCSIGLEEAQSYGNDRMPPEGIDRVVMSEVVECGCVL